MKQLSDKDQLHRVVRELDECPAVKRWLVESREENRGLLEGCGPEDVKHLQGQNSTINQILAKDTDLQ